MNLKNNFQFLALIIASIYTLIPARLSALIPFVQLEESEAVRAFGTVYPIISWIDMAIFLYLIFAILILRGKIINQNFKVFKIFSLVSLICIIYQWFQYAFSDESFHYFDSFVLFFRTTLIYGVWILVKGRMRYKALTITLLVASITSIIVFYYGGLYSDRINLPGFEITSSAYAAGVMILLAVRLYDGLLKILIPTFGIIALLLTGSRFPLIAVFALLIFNSVLASEIGLTKKIFTVILVVILGFSSYMIQMNLKGDGSKGIFESVAEMNAGSESHQSLDSNSLTGRLFAVKAGISVLYDNFPMPLVSDWKVQEQLIIFGYPSHVHVGALQLLIKYGIFSIVFFFYLIRVIYEQFKINLISFLPLLLLSTSLLFDYIFFVPTIFAFLLIFADTDAKNYK